MDDPPVTQLSLFPQQSHLQLSQPSRPAPNPLSSLRTSSYTSNIPSNAPSSLPQHSFFWYRQKVSFLASRKRKIYSLCHLWQVYLVQQGWIIHHIDCAVTFSTYCIINECLSSGISPECVADKIQVTRAFTPYQIITAMQRILDNPALQTRAIFVTAILKQFFDGDVKKEEGLFLFKKLLRICYQLQNLKISMIIIDRDHYESPIFLEMYKSLQKLASHNFYYNESLRRIVSRAA